MTIEEIKSVSIVQFLESQGYHHVYILKENYWYQYEYLHCFHVAKVIRLSLTTRKKLPLPYYI